MYILIFFAFLISSTTSLTGIDCRENCDLKNISSSETELVLYFTLIKYLFYCLIEISKLLI